MDSTRISFGAGFHNREVSNEEMRLLLCAKNSGIQGEEETAIITKSSRGWMIRTTPCHLPRFSPFLFQTNTPSTSQSPSSKHSTPSRISHHRNPQDTRINTPRPPPGTPSPSALVVETGTCASRALAQRINRATYPHPHPHFPLPLFISHLVMLKSVLDPQSCPIQASLCRNDIASALLPSVPRVIIIGAFGVYKDERF